MTEREAIEKIKQTPLMRYIADRNPKGELGEALEMAVEALEKQIPKKPKKIEDMEDLARTFFIECQCGAMNHVDIKHKDIYCWKCGQRLDWGE